MADGMVQTLALPGRFFIGQGRQFSTNSAAPPADELLAVPFNAILLSDALALNVIEAGSEDAVCRLGLYARDPETGIPTSAIERSDEISLAAIGVHLATFEAIRSIQDPVCLVALFNAAETMPVITVTTPVAEELHRILGAPSFTAVPFTNVFNGAVAAYSYAPLPASFPTPSIGTVHTAIALRSA